MLEKIKERQKEINKLRKSGLTLDQIGKIYHISRQRIHQILNKDYRFKKEDDMPLSDTYPQLRKLGGREYNRELVRIRDRFTCQLCGKKWKTSERRFDIHHIDCAKEKTRQYDNPSEFGNLITLCHKCYLNVPAHKKTMSENWSYKKRELKLSTV